MARSGGDGRSWSPSSSKVANPRTFRSSRQPGSNWSSISRLRKPWGSPCPRQSWFAPTSSSNDRRRSAHSRDELALAEGKSERLGRHGVGDVLVELVIERREYRKWLGRERD